MKATTPTQLSHLSPNEKNPRAISEEQLNGLKKSIIEFGDLSGFVFNVKSQKLVGAHQRTKVMPPSTPIVILNTYEKPTRTGTVRDGYVELDGERFSYREVKWSEKREAAAMIAANKHGGVFDKGSLASLISTLDTDLRGITGFSQVELDKLVAMSVPPTQFQQFDENIPVQHKCPKCGHTWSGKASR